MGEQLGDSVDGRPIAGQDGGVGMTEVVEGDVLVDAGILDPAGDAAVEGAAMELVEDKAFLALAEKLVGFLVDGDDGVGTGFLGDDLEGVALVGGHDDIVPGEALDVGDTEAAEAGKEAGALDLFVFAGSLCKTADFLDGEVFFVDGVDGNGLQLGDDIIRNELVFLGAADDHLEVHPKVRGAVVGDEAFVVEAGFSGEEVFAEFLAELQGDVGDGAFAAGVAEEMLEDASGVVAGLVGDVLKILDEIDLAAGVVGKTELLFEDGYLALGADGFGDLELFVVALALGGVFGLFEEVDAQVLPAAELAGAGISHGRVEVQVEGNLAAGELSFSKGYFSCRHNLPSGFYRVVFCRRILGRRF